MAVILLNFKKSHPNLLPWAPEPVPKSGQINRLCSERTLLLQTAGDFIN
jgi:hypothetical protein